MTKFLSASAAEDGMVLDHGSFAALSTIGTMTKEQPETAVILILTVAIVGQLVTLALVTPFYGLLTAALIAPIGGGLAAVAAGVFLSRNS